MTGILPRREEDVEPRRKTIGKLRRKPATYMLRKEASEEINPDDTVISDW